MSVAIIGDRGCGKTVFLSLLYDAQVEYTNETEGKFRFYANPGFTNTMGEVINSMLNQNWPEATIKGLLAKYWFLYGYQNIFGKYNCLKFTVYDIAGEDVNIVNDLIALYTTEGGIESINYDDLPDGLKTLLDCNVLVFIIDLSRINAEPKSEEFKRMHRYDITMATLISLVAEYKAKKACSLSGEHRKLYPVFVFTKFDMVEKKIFDGLKLSPKYPRLEKRPIDIVGGWFDLQSKSSQERIRYGDILMDAFYKNTRGLLIGYYSLVDFEKSAYFFSEIQTEKDEDGLLVPSIEGGKARLKYSIDEYKAFINYFKEIADKMPDEVKDEFPYKDQKILTKKDFEIPVRDQTKVQTVVQIPVQQVASQQQPQLESKTPGESIVDATQLLNNGSIEDWLRTIEDCILNNKEIDVKENSYTSKGYRNLLFALFKLDTGRYTEGEGEITGIFKDEFTRRFASLLYTLIKNNKLEIPVSTTSDLKYFTSGLKLITPKEEGKPKPREWNISARGVRLGKIKKEVEKREDGTAKKIIFIWERDTTGQS